MKVVTRLFILLMATLLTGCSSMPYADLEKPDIRVTEVTRLSGKNFLEQRFALRLQLHNPNNRRFHIQRIAFQLDTAGYPLMQGNSQNIPVIEPLGDITFTVDATASVLDTLRLLEQLGRHPSETVHYTLRTNITLAEGWPSQFALENDGEINMRDALEKQHEKRLRKRQSHADH